MNNFKVVLVACLAVLVASRVANGEKCSSIPNAKRVNFTELEVLDKWWLQQSNFVSENCSVWNFTVNPKKPFSSGFLAFVGLEPDGYIEYGSFYLEEMQSTPNQYNLYSVSNTKDAPVLSGKPVGTNGSFVQYKKDEGFIFFLCIDNTQYYWILTASQNAEHVATKYLKIIESINRSDLKNEGKAVMQSCVSS